MIYFIYKTTNLVNGKIYIGQHVTKDENDGYLGSGTSFLNAVRKYGRVNFVREILMYCNGVDELNEFEIKLIEQHNATNRDIGYNIAKGGLGALGTVLSPESREKIASARRGTKASEETRAKLRIAKGGQNSPSYGKPGFFKDKKFSEQHKRNISKARTGYKMKDVSKIKISNFRKTVKLTEEHKKSISKANKGKKLSAEHVNVISKKAIEMNSKIVECPYCKNVCKYLNAMRWHFDNCKLKPIAQC